MGLEILKPGDVQVCLGDGLAPQVASSGLLVPGILGLWSCSSHTEGRRDDKSIQMNWDNPSSTGSSGDQGKGSVSELCFCLQAEKYEDGILQNNGELTVRAKLVLPSGPRKVQEAQEGWLPPDF